MAAQIREFRKNEFQPARLVPLSLRTLANHNDASQQTESDMAGRSVPELNWRPINSS